MNILTTQYTLQTKSLDIYIAGCSGSPHCKNCHNPESWDFSLGEPYDGVYWNKLSIKLQEFDTIIDNIMIFGGEPLDNNLDELYQLLLDLSLTDKKIWLFTRYDLPNMPDFVKRYCNYIKCGRYIEELKSDDNVQYGIKLATSNQKIYKKGIDY
ncbi:MAG: 4Fe-4S cluster-binding domain-containing protein [Candidatus Pacebacteria bacterium]|nr:4Fe-4S cluster-binding domain-containing protein [Candidatus Paceibacterota bacterium]